jgi:dipeptidase E
MSGRRLKPSGGFRIRLNDLKGKTRKGLQGEMEGISIVYVCVGNTLCMLEKAIESGFDRLVKELTGRGVIYAGESAGSIIAGPDIGLIEFMDDPSAASLKDFSGLALVDFAVLPHCGTKENAEGYERANRTLKPGYKTVPLRDGQAVVVKERAGR